jgi:hypothetical protein
MEALLDVVGNGKSAQYLRTSGQEADLEFVLTHVDDLDLVPRLVDGELITRHSVEPVGEVTSFRRDGRVA